MKSVTRGANWSGRISLNSGSVERARHGSHGCPNQDGALRRKPPSASHRVSTVKNTSSHVRARLRATTTDANVTAATPPPT